MTQHVEPTHGNSILDLILSSDPNLVDKVIITAPLGTGYYNLLESEMNIGCEIIQYSRASLEHNVRGT